MPKPATRKASPKPREEVVEEVTLPLDELPVEDDGPELPASPDYCRVVGVTDHTVNTMAHFTVESCNALGNRKRTGGDAFFIAIRGASRVRARVTDNTDGTYTIAWKPIVSGHYSIAVSLFGNAIAGSPFDLIVHDPAPYAPKCEVSGKALNHITARTNSTFEIRYRDRSGNTAQAVELDVYVMPVDDEGAPMLWEAATQPKMEGVEQVTTVSASDVSAMPTGGSEKRKGGKGGKRGTEAAPAPAPAPAPAAAVSSSFGAISEDGVMLGEDGELIDGEGAEEQAGADALVAVEQAFIRQRALRIQVGDKPLIVRAEAALTSEQIGMLLPNQMVTVVEERITEGNVRACVTFEEMPPPSPRLGANGSAPGSPEAGGSGADADALGEDASAAGASVAVMDSVRSGSASAAVPGSPERRKTITGWVTLKKEGKKLVSSRLRLEPTNRQQHMQQWKRRQLNDKLKRGVQTEVAVDPTRVAFAFGGVYPGWLHSKGQLLNAHQVSYSVGKVGRYLLHVRLRKQATSVPGSPFALTVKPGPAHSMSTKLDPAPETLKGVVGSGAEEGVRLIMQAADQMGNICTEGGAVVKTEVVNNGKDIRKGPEVEANVEDLQNGSYLLHYRSKTSGVYEIKVTIDGIQVEGSPCKIRLLSSTPELHKSELDGPGLKQAVAGERAPVTIRFFDQFGNLAFPSETFKVGLAVTTELRKKVQDVKEHDFDGKWSTDKDGEYLINYIAEAAGHQEMHVWSDPNSKGERIAFPGSPFSVSVNAGMPSPSISHVDGWTLEIRASADKAGVHSKKKPSGGEDESSKIIAGDTIGVSPLIVDQFSNPIKTIEEGAITSKVIRPNGSEVALQVQQQVRSLKGISEAVYAVRYETSHAGTHAFHVMLAGVAIVGSPVSFDVLPATPDTQMSKLLLPEHSDALDADYDRPSIVILKTYDKYGNPCKTGGLLPNGRLTLIKKDASDQTLLMPNNHSVIVEDKMDGTYEVRVAIRMMATVKLTVNMDKNMPGGTGEMPAEVLHFTQVAGDGSAAAPAVAATPANEKAEPGAKRGGLRRQPSSLGRGRMSSKELPSTSAADELASAVEYLNVDEGAAVGGGLSGDSIQAADSRGSVQAASSTGSRGSHRGSFVKPGASGGTVSAMNSLTSQGSDKSKVPKRVALPPPVPE